MVIAFLWLIVLALAVAILRLPAAVDLYFKDHYYPITKLYLLLVFCAFFVVPLLVFTLKRS